MPAPSITFTSQSRSDRIITVVFVVKGAPTSVTVELPVATVPNGAVAPAIQTVVPNVYGECTASFTALSYGDYGLAIVNATNADGTTTLTFPSPEPFMRLFVPGTATPGTARAFLPPFTVPAFNSPTIAIGADIAPITLVNTSTTLQGGGPFTIGHPFWRGHLKPGDFLVGKIAGQADLPLQFNVKSTHQDGSIRHAIISGIAPVMAPGTSLTVMLVRASSGTSTTAFSPNVVANAPGFSAMIDLQISGTSYSVNVSTALLAGVAPNKVWIGGTLVSEFILDLPVLSESGTPHPLLTLPICVRHYPSINATRLDVAFENTKAYSAISDVSYTGTIKVGGVTKRVISKYGDTTSPLVHYVCSRWHHVCWHNNPNPVFVKHDVDYLIDSKAVPNYDRRVKNVNPATIVEYKEHLSSITTSPMEYGRYDRYMPQTGGRNELGIVPDEHAITILTMDKTAYDMMLASGDCGGSWFIHRRDESDGPGRGRPIDIIHWPRVTILGTTSDSLNRATGKAEKFPGATTANPGTPDNSHHSSFGFLPYLLAGDWYYFETMAFWAAYVLNQLNPGFRSSEKGIYSSGQPRAQAWTTRTLGQVAAFAPDDYPLKQSYQYWLDNNLSGYNVRYSDNPDANLLGIMIDGPQGIIYNGDRGVSPWMDHFFTMSVGHVAELGYDKALKLLKYKAKFPVGMMIGPGACFINAGEYYYNVRDTPTSPLYTTHAKAQEETTWPSVWALPCNSPERLEEYKARSGNVRYVLNEMIGRTGNTEGYPTILGAALAFSVDSDGVPDADLAWDLFETRQPKPDYTTGAQFAIVPRGITLAEPDPVDPPVEPPTPTPPAPTDSYSVTVGSGLYFGRNP